MAKSFQVTPTLRIGNVVVSALLRRGVKVGSMSLLTVPGRKSGLPRTTPIFLLERDGERWLTSPYGDVNWVRNLRAAGRATLTRGLFARGDRARGAPSSHLSRGWRVCLRNDAELVPVTPCAVVGAQA